MGIELKSQSDVGMPQDFRQSSDIHPSFKCSCCEGVAKSMDTKSFDPLLSQNSVKCPSQVPPFVRSSDFSGEHKIKRMPLVSCCQPGFKLLPSLNCKNLFQFRSQGNGSSSCFGFRCACLQTGSPRIILIKIPISANGLGNAELILLNVRPPESCQFSQSHSCSENEIQSSA